MDSFLLRLDETRANNYEQMKAIVATAESENRDLTAEESERWDKLDAEIVSIDARKRQLTDAEARAKAADALRVEHAAVLTPKPDSRTDADNFRALWRGEISGFESRALSTPGGSAIPTTFYDQVMVYARTLNPVLNVATVLNTTSGEPITFPRLTSDVSTGGTVVAEAAGISLKDPTLSSVNLSAFKIGAITVWSKELDEDNAIGLQDLVARSVGRDIGLATGTWFTTGAGSTLPYGFVTRAGVAGTADGTANNTAKDTFFAAADLVTAFFSLAAPYRANATWMVSTTALAKIRKFRDADNNFVFQLGVGTPDTILGRPVYENPAMAAVASASKSVAVGDFSRYFVRMTPMRVEVSTEYGFTTDQIAIKAVQRVDGDLIDTDAIKTLVSANT